MIKLIYMDQAKLKEIAQTMMAPGKGIMAIDESTGTNKKRFEAAGVEVTEENRRLYRQMLVTADVADFISGYILYDETLRQKTDDGIPFPVVLAEKGILPGIKLDTGAKDMALHEGEKVTEGLDGLRERIAEYKKLGAQFAKWRAAIAISNTLPSQACMKANAHALARYAALCQEAGIVPMVEPEMLINGDHSQERCYEVSKQMLQILFKELEEQGVMLEGTILKTSMVISGLETKNRATPEEVAKETVRLFKEVVPPKLAGIVFLSGGQTDEESALHLSLMNQLGEKLPWSLSFSYGRAIQNPAMEIWSKNFADVEKAQVALRYRSQANALASKGEYTLEFENKRPY